MAPEPTVRGQDPGHVRRLRPRVPATDRSADGVICVRCGFVHTFMGDAHQFVDPAVVKPEDLPDDPLAPTS